MVEDVFNTRFPFFTTKTSTNRPSLITSRNKMMCTCIPSCVGLCSKYEYNWSIHGRDMVADARTHGHESRAQIHKAHFGLCPTGANNHTLSFRVHRNLFRVCWFHIKRFILFYLFYVSIWATNEKDWGREAGIHGYPGEDEVMLCIAGNFNAHVGLVEPDE